MILIIMYSLWIILSFGLFVYGNYVERIKKFVYIDSYNVVL